VGPIDIRYHAISIAAVFLALGVGIIVGSSTNFFGITSILDRQNRVIDRLEGNYKDIRKEVHDTRVELNTTKQYTASLEDETIPRLLSGKLDGFRYGVIMVGGLPEGTSENSLLGPLKSAGAANAYDLHVAPEKLTELADDNTGDFVARFGKEILRGAAFGSKYTDPLMKDGSVISGGFEKPVDGIVFLIGENIDPKVIREILIPIGNLVRENKGVALAAVYGVKKDYEEIFKTANIHYFSNADTLAGDIEIITHLEEINKQKQGLK
jgi:hypothetical protein